MAADKFDEMANEAVRAYDTMAATRKRVSALVRRAVEEARAEEREACAQECDHWARPRRADDLDLDDSRWKVKQAAAAIRARAAKEGK